MLENLLIVVTLCMDTFAASTAYGSSRIRIPFVSAAIITMVGSAFLTISLFAASILSQYIPQHICLLLGFLILFAMGIHNLFSGTIKAYMRRKISIDKTMRLKSSGVSLVFKVYLDETVADLDHSKTLSPREAIYLASALSMDSLVLGFGSGFGLENSLVLILMSLVAGFLAVYGGCILGQVLARHSTIDLSWMTGVILILLSIARLVKLL